MAQNKTPFLTKLQMLFGTTKSELIFVFVLFIGLFGGLIIKYLTNNNDEIPNKELSNIVYKSLDSLAEINRTTYIGTDVHDNPIPELKQGDTLEDKEYFHGSKKEMPLGKIDINSASKVELMKLPGIGVKTALSIIDYRDAHHFQKPEDVMKIKGIGPEKFEKMKNYIEVK
ncbi:MAG: helix-hairpin-helix domain-containing protein [FCB group bacterium]|jgi:competence protein ComEA